jgi:hypothetical protein
VIATFAIFRILKYLYRRSNPYPTWRYLPLRQNDRVNVEDNRILLTNSTASTNIAVGNESSNTRTSRSNSQNIQSHTGLYGTYEPNFRAQ